MAVRVWVRANNSRVVSADSSDDVLVRLRPLTGCPAPTPSDPIDSASRDFRTCCRWLDGFTRGVEMVWRQRNGRHIRARTVEAASLLLDDTLGDMVQMLACHRWHTMGGALRPGDGWPLPASLELQTSSAVHFLCLLRGRLAGGAIVADIWKRVILEVLPCVARFGYSPRSGTPWVALYSLPRLPSERHEGWTRAAATELLDDADDAILLDALRDSWRGATAQPTGTACTALSSAVAGPTVRSHLAALLTIGGAVQIKVSLRLGKPGGR